MSLSMSHYHRRPCEFSLRICLPLASWAWCCLLRQSGGNSEVRSEPPPCWLERWTRRISACRPAIAWAPLGPTSFRYLPFCSPVTPSPVPLCKLGVNGSGYFLVWSVSAWFCLSEYPPHPDCKNSDTFSSSPLSCRQAWLEYMQEVVAKVPSNFLYEIAPSLLDFVVLAFAQVFTRGFAAESFRMRFRERPAGWADPNGQSKPSKEASGAGVCFTAASIDSTCATREVPGADQTETNKTDWKEDNTKPSETETCQWGHLWDTSGTLYTPFRNYYAIYPSRITLHNRKKLFRDILAQWQNDRCANRFLEAC